MRVLFATWAWPTHFFPMVPLAWALRAAGHEVLVASQPSLLPAIGRAGLTGVAVGPDVGSPAQVAETVRNAGGSGRLRTSVRMAEAMVDGLLSTATRWRPDVIVQEPTTYAGPLVAARLGIASVRHLWGMDIHRHAQPYELEAFAPLCARLGLTGFRPQGDAVLDPCPPSLRLHPDSVAAPRIDMRYTVYNGSGALPRWLAGPAARKRICVTWGVAQSWRDRAARLRALTAALADLDVEVVLAVAPRDRAVFDELAATVRVCVMLPLQLALPSCGLLVSGGGNGSMLTGVSYGVPQLCLVAQHTERESSRALAAVGAGLSLEDDEVDAAQVADAAHRILDEPGFAEAASRLRAESAARPTPAAAARALRGLVEETR